MLRTIASQAARRRRHRHPNGGGLAAGGSVGMPSSSSGALLGGGMGIGGERGLTLPPLHYDNDDGRSGGRMIAVAPSTIICPAGSALVLPSAVSDPQRCPHRHRRGGGGFSSGDNHQCPVRRYHSLARPSLSSSSGCASSGIQFSPSSHDSVLSPSSSSPSTTTIVQQQRRNKVFVSRHNNALNLSPQTIVSYLAGQRPHLDPNPGYNSDFRVNSSHVVMKECPFCPKPTGGKADNFYKLYIQIGGGAYFCHRCGAKGSWYDFKSEIGGFAVDGTSVMTAASGGARQQAANSPIRAAGGGWKASNNRGMGYPSTKQLMTNPGGNGDNNNAGHDNHFYNNNKQQQHNKTVDPLPMPPAKINSIYASRLFDPLNSTAHNPEEHKALQYLTETRGLSRAVLRKYGVGCAPYNFPDKDKKTGGMSYVSSMCVTFPWMMRCGEVAEQEELRGAEFAWKSEDEEGNGNDSSKATNKIANNGRDRKPNKKKPSEMTPLEKYHDRRAKKAAKKRRQEESAEDPSTLSPEERDRRAAVAQSEEPELTLEDVESLHGPYVPRRIKVRSASRKSWQRLDPPGGGFGLFGWHTVPHDASEIVLTEGEFDAMAVSQATGRPAVSLPNGCRSLPTEVLALLERFESIHLWMDDDGPGREGAEMFARKLGVERCLVVRPSGKRGLPAAWCDGSSSGPPPPVPKDANEALLQGWDLGELLDEADELPHERILKFSDLRDQVIHEIVNPEKYRGAPIPSLPGFTSLIKGFRRGEMTVLTGPTGSGKTTFLGQTSLDLAEQGVNVLWGSFEIKNTRLMHKLLQQYMKDVLPVGLADKDLSAEERRNKMAGLTALADKFETLPMHFMKFHGGSDVDDVLDAMEYAAYVHDVEHIILDNMQFMISRQSVGKGSSYDKFDMQDIAVEKFRKFATEYNVHVTLVVHPRKEEEGSRLGMSSFYGSAKATQEADTVVILQSDGKRKFVDVRKNRFDGTLGHVPLHFQRRSGRYSETPEVNAPPPRTMVPSGVSATAGVQARANGAARPAAAGASVYQDIRNQHPVS